MPSLCFAQESWQLNSSVTALTGHYADSLVMSEQHGLGVRLSGMKDGIWGLTVGGQSTRIEMTPSMPVSSQNQDNWLLSGYVHTLSVLMPGRLTFQLDAHKVRNDAPNSPSSDVNSIAPQVAWLSYTQPLKVDFSYARSNYKNTPSSIHQLSSAIAYGFNNATDWIHVRNYVINADALGQSTTRARDIKLTHFLSSQNKWSPAAITVGLERGKRIYVVDMSTQTVYNLPMLNEGGENISVNWKLSSKTDFNLQFSKSRYSSESAPVHQFTLGTLSAQISTTW